MGSIGSWFGSGAGLLAIGLGWLIIKFNYELPGKAQDFAMRAAIVIMGMGGCAVAVTALGYWAARMIRAVIGWGGNTGWAIATIIAASMVVIVVISLWKRPSAKAAYMAVALMLFLPVFGGGVLADIDKTVKAPGREGAAEMQAWLNGRGGQ